MRGSRTRGAYEHMATVRVESSGTERRETHLSLASLRLADRGRRCGNAKLLWGHLHYSKLNGGYSAFDSFLVKLRAGGAGAKA